ncbi:MAG TPA: glycine cleavage system protein GcvH [Kofleriaceae bacterium]|nr:glycine cleavage system protein GcvH [Kofleriaceae bacterium]
MAANSDIPDDLRYSKEHEWARVRGTRAQVGITRFAVEQLGDVTQLELPKEGEAVVKDEVFGTVESVKAVSDLFAPVSGKVAQVNSALHDKPETINEDPYQGGWLIEIEMSEPAQADALLSAADYRKLLAEQE